MALFLKVSNSLDSLAAGLAKNLQDAGNNVFQPYYIVTQTEGMNNWLKLQLAAHLGIAANCRFMKPNDLLYQLYSMLGGTYIAVLSPQNLSWLVFKLLGEETFIANYPDIANYYSDHVEECDVKRMALAEKIADLLDQYQIYRPEMILQWSGTAMPLLTTVEWQQWLWIQVKQLSGDALPDKTVVGSFILDALHNKELSAGLAARMPAIHLFGLSIITAYHVKILHELSACIDVHFHIINPAPGVFWFDDGNEKQWARWRHKNVNSTSVNNVGNTLLTGWGKVIQNSFQLFFSYDAFINAYEELGIVPPEPDSLLHKIQHDIFMAATSERHMLTTQHINDGSITINACYTVAREVEVLYNYLVHLVDQKQEPLSPRDIVVMVSDIDAYAPYIKAVFNNAPFKFRYTIADESFTGNDNIFNALHAILILNEENFKAEAVMQLLDFSFIRQRFTLQDPLRMRNIVEAANIRFGIEGHKENETHFVSWRYGIKRIMYGICMNGEEEYGEGADSFYPLDLLEGSDAYEMIRFCHFAEVLMDTVIERQRVRSIEEWVAYTERVLHHLVFEPLEEIHEDYTTLLNKLTAYNALHELMRDKVTYEVFCHSFLATLNSTTRAGLFANGGITFCSLIPMRSIPFKVVALMGLNYDKFPRHENMSSFNIMERNKKRGDRNVKENDKHLFLETILSAKKYLYISYIGKSAKDNTILPPSALIDEMVDYIAAGAADPGTVRSMLITHQPLQGFSRKYASQDNRLYSYLNEKMPVKKVTINEKQVAVPLTLEEISLEELVSFFKNPIKAYYNKILGIYYNDEQILLNETEIFSMDHLQQWAVKNTLLAETGTDIDVLQKTLVRKGLLPLGNMAAVVIQQLEEKVMPVRSMYETLTAGALEKSVSFELTIDNSILKGTINKVFNGHAVRVSWSGFNNKHLVEAYIRYLAGIASGTLDGMYFISGVQNETVGNAVMLTKAEAYQRLIEIIKIYKAGFVDIMPFYPDFTPAPKDLPSLNMVEFIKTIDNKLNNYFNFSPDPYVMQEYEKGYFKREEVLASFKNVCQLLIAPLAAVFPAYCDKETK